MRFVSHANSGRSAPKLTLSLATTEKEVREVQKLRHKTMAYAMSFHGLVNPDGIDIDELDQHCDHVIVRDSSSLRVVGAYRVMSPAAARKFGRYDAEQQFDIGRLDHLRDRIVEAGRASIHPDYRNSAVVSLLWAGVAAFMQRERCDYLMGRASVSLADGGHNAAAIYHSLTPENLGPAEYRVMAHTPFPVGEARSVFVSPALPPLLKTYLQHRAWVAGGPAWEPDFHTADFFFLLPLTHLNRRSAPAPDTGTRSNSGGFIEH